LTKITTVQYNKYLSNLRLGVEKMRQEVVAGEAGGHVRGGDLQQLLHVHVLKKDPEAEFLDEILTTKS
jgi:hypothetical protein